MDDPSHDFERPGAGGVRRKPIPLLRALLAGLIATWCVVVAHEALPVHPGETAALAWLRLAAEHPARLGAALTLVAWALAPGRPSPSADSGKEPPRGLSSRGPFSGNAAHPQAPPHRSPWPKS